MATQRICDYDCQNTEPDTQSGWLVVSSEQGGYDADFCSFTCLTGWAAQFVPPEDNG